MAPPLGLALALALIVALVYAVVAARPLWALPFYWLLAVAGLLGGQAIAALGLRWLSVGDFVLGTGLGACLVLFGVLHLLALWYTRGRRALRRGPPRDGPSRDGPSHDGLSRDRRPEPIRRERLHRR
jgi:hypothetical protein